MSYTDHLFKLAERLARKISLAQAQSAQPGEIMAVLKSAGLWEKTQEVAPLLAKAGISDDATVAISIVVDSKLDVNYVVQTNPPAAAIKLRGLLKAKYGAAMKTALQAAKISVTDTMTLGWMNF